MELVARAVSVAIATGRTTRNIVVARRIGTALQQIGLAEPPAVIRYRNAGPMLNSASASKAGTWRAIVARAADLLAGTQAAGSAAVAAVAVSPTVGAALDSAIAAVIPAWAEAPIASAAAIFRAAAGVTGAPLAAVPGDSTDRARGAAAVAAPRAWGLEAEASVAEEEDFVVAAAAGADRQPESHQTKGAPI